MTLGAVAGSTFGVVIDGSILGNGVYKDVTANGLQIGGLGGAVTIAGGIAVNGSVQAVSNNASATALRIGSGASAPEIRVAGNILAGGGGVAAATSTAIAVDAGASVATIRNYGQIKAASAGLDGSAFAIVDRSGSVTLVENSGVIGAAGAAAGRNIAIDLRANTGGATVRQLAGVTGADAPNISGDIYFGSGNDTLALGGKSSFTGTTDFGGGSDQLTITEDSSFTGAILRSGSLAVNVASGTLALATRSPVALGSLAVGAQGILGVTIDGAAKTSTRFDIAGAASASAVLDIGDAPRFGQTIRQMLPDHAGGTFEAVTQGSRATARLLADPTVARGDNGPWSSWLQQVAWGHSKGIASTAGFDVSGWGIAGGGEAATRVGSFGLSGAFLYGKNDDGGTDNQVNADQYEVAAYWRGNWGGFSANARGSAARIDFSGTRHFDGLIGREEVARVTEGSWNGRLLSASGAMAYEVRFGRMSLRPIAAVDYYHLHEGSYSEAGGGKAFDLIVASRDSDELAASATLAASFNFGGKADENWFRVEAEGGRRQLVGGSLSDTTAHFEGGKDFTLPAADRTNGWVGRLRATGGNGGFRFVGEFSAEQQQGRAAVSARAGLTFAL